MEHLTDSTMWALDNYQTQMLRVSILSFAKDCSNANLFWCWYVKYLPLVATDISRLLTRSASEKWSFQTNPHIWACCSVSNIWLQAMKNCWGGNFNIFSFYQSHSKTSAVMMMFKLPGINSKTKKNTKTQLPSFTAYLYVNPKFMFWVSGCTLPESIPLQTRHSFMRRKKGRKKLQHRKLPEDLKKQREHKTHANYIPLASGFFLKRFIFSSEVWTPLLLSFPPPRLPPPPPPTVRAFFWV